LQNGGEITKEQFATVFSKNQLTINYLHNVKIEDISPESILNLTHRVEVEIEEKDEVIADKTAALQKAQAKISQKDNELAKLNIEKEDLIKRISESEERQHQTEIEIAKLKVEKERNEYVDDKMDMEFYPLSKKLWSFLVGFVAALILMYFAEVADDGDYQMLKISVEWRKWIKFIGFIYPLIFALINFKLISPIIRYRFDHSSLKREYEKKFKHEYDNNSKA
jgi:cation transport ATPase